MKTEISRRGFVFLAGLVPTVAGRSAQRPVRIRLRRRVEVFRGTDEWRPVEFDEELAPERTAIILCDMWDLHWCQGANKRVAVLVRRAVPLLDAARRRGALIIHAPSDTMEFYREAPQRQAILRFPRVPPPTPLTLTDPPLPVTSPRGGCDTPGDWEHRTWTRQHEGIPIAAGDLISDRGEEVYSALKARNIAHLLVMGVHTNMCILNRSFAIRQMSRWGVRCVLIRDLTDAMYDPQDPPHVSHERGTEMVIEHIEKHWCPTALSADLLAVL